MKSRTASSNNKLTYSERLTRYNSEKRRAIRDNPNLNAIEIQELIRKIGEKYRI